MSLLKEFELKTGISAKGLTEEILVEIMKNERFEEFFSKPGKTVELIDELLSELSDSDFKKEIHTARETFNLANIEYLISKIFSDFKNEKINEDDFEKKIVSAFNSLDPIYSISMLVCVLISKYDLKEFEKCDYFETFKSAISQIENIFHSLGRIENSYRYRTEIIDFLYTAREEYFLRFEKDILEDCGWLEMEIDKLDEFESQFISNEFPEIDISPNELGLIDITKLPKN